MESVDFDLAFDGSIGGEDGNLGLVCYEQALGGALLGGVGRRLESEKGCAAERLEGESLEERAEERWECHEGMMFE